MKLALSTVAMIVCLIAGARATQARTLDDFLNIKWGASKAEAKRIMLQRPGTTFDAENSTDEALIFNGGEFAGRPVSFILLRFSGEGLHTATVYIKADRRDHDVVMPIYRGIKELLQRKYGDPDHDFYFFKDPYEEGDGYESTAISVGKAVISAYWFFDPSVGSEEQNVISVSVDPDFYVIVAYQNGAMVSRAIEKQKEESLNDL